MEEITVEELERVENERNYRINRKKKNSALNLSLTVNSNRAFYSADFLEKT